MKNTKLTVGLIACLMSVSGLAGCDNKVRASNDGVLLTYTVDGVKNKITADQILEKAYDDSSKYQAIYDIIYNVLVKNYFNRDIKVDYYGNTVSIGAKDMGKPTDAAAYGSEGSIYALAKQKVEDDKTTAHTTADNNGTSYKKEFEKILESKGVKDNKELLEKYIEELQKEVFEKNFYTYYIEDLKQGAGATKVIGDDYANQKSAELKEFWPGYFEDQMPYHVSHILVKLEDSSGTNYADGTISESNAKNLYNVVHALEEGKHSFSLIAKQYTEDEGSRSVAGDLGIMDLSTSFVNEFKLGIYAYENLYGSEKADVVKKSRINISKEIKDDYETAVVGSFAASEIAGGVPTIDYKVFDDLYNQADIDKDENKAPVLDGAASLYPRNIIYNKYLNRHAVAFIAGGPEQTNPNATTGYVKYDSGKLAFANTGKTILSAKVAGVWRPIICVRAGSEYQGIHFIVVNRSPFLTGEDANKVTQSEYYTTFFTKEDLYPHTGTKAEDNIVKKTTFVNFSYPDVDDVTNTKKKAEEVTSKLKSFDSDRLGKYIFKKYMAEEKVVIHQEKLKASLEKWINTSVEKAAAEREETWSKTWHDYIDTLYRQGSERSKLVPEACRLAYLGANQKDVKVEDLVIKKIPMGAQIKALLVKEGLDEKLAEKTIRDWFQTKGGLCNDGKDHF